MTQEFLYKFICWCTEKEITNHFDNLFFSYHNGNGPFFESTSNEEKYLSIYVNLNDYFYYAAADCEEITEENFHLLKEAHQELYDDIVGDSINKEVYSASYAFDLYAIKVRNQLPLQPHLDKLECGIKEIFIKAIK